VKRILCIILIAVMCLSFTACSNSDNANKDLSQQAAQMKSICELATMQCYYHNVAKYDEKDATGVLFWKKDRQFWIEYSGIVTIGINTSLVSIDVDGENVTITIPPAQVLSCKVDDKTLNVDSFIVANDSASVEAEHQTKAFQEAQAKMQEDASNDTALLASAQQRAQKLLEDYVNNIGECTGKSYKIKWVYLDGAKDLNELDIDVATQTVEE